MRSGAPLSIAACMLAGGEGRRMQGQDKGLMRHRGRPLGDWVLESLAGQAGVRIDALWVSANRNRAAYAALLGPAGGALSAFDYLLWCGEGYPELAGIAPAGSLHDQLAHGHTPPRLIPLVGRQGFTIYRNWR